MSIEDLMRRMSDEMDGFGSPIAVINYLHDIPTNEDYDHFYEVLKNSEVLFENPKNEAEFWEVLNSVWDKNNRQYLYILSHADSEGIFSEENRNGFISKRQLSEINNVDLVVFAACNSQEIACYCHYTANCKAFVGTTIDVDSECTQFVQEFFESMVDNGNYDPRSHKELVEAVNEVLGEDVFVLFGD